MYNDDVKGLTDLINNAKTPDEKAELWNILFPRLRNIARSRIAAVGKTGQERPTELVNDLYFRLDNALNRPEVQFESRGHFYAYAAQSMRRHLAAIIRKKMAEEVLDDSFSMETASPELTIALDDTLDDLMKRFPRAVRAFELRYAGHSYDEILKLMESEYNTKASLAADLTMVRKYLASILVSGGKVRATSVRSRTAP